MPKQAQATNAVYKVTEIIGTSTKSWEDAARNAVETAARTLRDLRVAEVVKTDLKVENAAVTALPSPARNGAASTKFEAWFKLRMDSAST